MVEYEPYHKFYRYTDHFRPVVEFLSYQRNHIREFPTLYTDEYFQWKIADNPFGLSACYLRHQDGRAVSHSSATSKPINPILGVGVEGGELGDTHTYPDFQRQGHFSALGNFLINDFSQSRHNGSKLIYTFPNEQAIIPYTRHCGCEIYHRVTIDQLLWKPWKSIFAAARSGFHTVKRGIIERSEQLHLCGDIEKTKSDIDELWQDAVQKENYLIIKDGEWWKWRYIKSSEKYLTYTYRKNRANHLLAYIVIKETPCSVKFFRCIQICELFGITEALMIEAFNIFMRTMIWSKHTVILWVHPNTALSEAAYRFGFYKTKSIPILFVKNESYRNLSRRNARLLVALGDSDRA